MSSTWRRRFSAELKAKVALNAIRGEQTVNDLTARYQFHPKIITNWKRQAIENMAAVFSGTVERDNKVNDDWIESSNTRRPHFNRDNRTPD